MGLIIAIILIILFFGFFMKLLKFAIIAAIVVGGIMYAQKKLGNKGGPRLK